MSNSAPSGPSPGELIASGAMGKPSSHGAEPAQGQVSSGSAPSAIDTIPTGDEAGMFPIHGKGIDAGFGGDYGEFFGALTHNAPLAQNPAGIAKTFEFVGLNTEGVAGQGVNGVGEISLDKTTSIGSAPAAFGAGAHDILSKTTADSGRGG